MPNLSPDASGPLADQWNTQTGVPLSWWIENQPDWTWQYVQGIDIADWIRFNPSFTWTHAVGVDISAWILNNPAWTWANVTDLPLSAWIADNPGWVQANVPGVQIADWIVYNPTWTQAHIPGVSLDDWVRYNPLYAWNNIPNIPESVWDILDPPQHAMIAGLASDAGPLGLSPDEITNADTVLSEGLDLKADDLAFMTVCCIGWGENHWNNTTCNSGGYCGVFQIGASWQARHALSDLRYWARYAFENGFYGYGGILSLAAKYPRASPGRLANMCQGAYANLDTGAQYYDQYDSLARDTINTLLHGAHIPTAASGISQGAGVGAGSPSPASAPTTGGVFDTFKALNWAGDFENLFAYMRGGANEAAKMADDYEAQRVNKITTIGWA